MKAVAVIIGVMLFLWSAAVVATGLSFVVTDGRLGRQEWYKVAIAVVILIACTVGFFVMDMDTTLRTPESDTVQPPP